MDSQPSESQQLCHWGMEGVLWKVSPATELDQKAVALWMPRPSVGTCQPIWFFQSPVEMHSSKAVKGREWLG